MDLAAASSSSGSGTGPVVRFKTEFEKNVLLTNFEKLHWKRTTSESDWNFFWATVYTARHLFGPSDKGGFSRLGDDQILNHFPTHLELTRKDLMVKNLKRYRKEMDRAGAVDAVSAALSDPSVPAVAAPFIDFFPLTYTLPSEWGVFAEEFKRASASPAAQANPASVVWIVKPNAKSQGKGIELIYKMSQLRKWAARERIGASGGGGASGAAAGAGGTGGATGSNAAPEAPRHSFVVSRYIADPLLIGGIKFDLRLYVLVTSYRPLKAWSYREGFARFCNVKYSPSASSLRDSEMHLTNVAIQKHGEGYNSRHGNKWSVSNLRLYLEGHYGAPRTTRCFEQIRFVFIHSLRAVAPRMSSEKHCFELYGFDLLLDSNLKPWLLEVNASPSLSVTTPADRALKTKLIEDTLRVVVPPDFPDTTKSRGNTSWNPAMQVGGFELIYDEALMAAPPMPPPSEESGASRAGASTAGGGRPSTAAASYGSGTGGALYAGYGSNAPSSASESKPQGKWR